VNILLSTKGFPKAYSKQFTVKDVGALTHHCNEDSVEDQKEISYNDASISITKLFCSLQ
jgi:hypothetical protein